MPEFVSIKSMPKEFKIVLLKKLGYNSDGRYVLTKNNEKLLDRYTKEPVEISNMFIYPGSTIILDNNLLSISSFMEEYEDDIGFNWW